MCDKEHSKILMVLYRKSYYSLMLWHYYRNRKQRIIEIELDIVLYK